jgi:hypothetical protein
VLHPAQFDTVLGTELRALHMLVLCVLPLSYIHNPRFFMEFFIDSISVVYKVFFPLTDTTF